MLVYRLSLEQFARDLSGTGARIFGGRWNHPGIPCVYTAGSRSLALLEFSVNAAPQDVPATLALVTIETGMARIRRTTAKDIPSDWREFPAPASTRDAGTKWLRDPKAAVIRVPSVIVPEEFNFILNPLHASFRDTRVVSVEPFAYDKRIKGG